ncbi:MAG: MATE family efflux transporter [Cyanobacteria bacterium SBLK]|nr:MATE family efflux transporter [Cyanobacteria bacterium SBLK]
MENFKWYRDFLNPLLLSKIYQEVKICLSLALPLAIAQISELSIIAFDTWTMGRLGSQILAGGALGYMTFRYIFTIGLCTISAINTVSSIAFGAKELQKLSYIPTQGFYLSLILALPMMVILGSASIWMNFLGQEAANIYLAQSYLKAVLWGLPALFCYEVLRNVLVAINRPKMITAIATFSIFLNAGANYIFAFGKFGLPNLGLAGIGWATTTVFWFQLSAALIFILLSPDLAEYKLINTKFPFQLSVFKEIIKIGWASGGHWISAGGSTLVLVYLFGYLGSVPLAAYQIARQMNNIIRHIILGLAQAVTARVGQMYGQQDKRGVQYAGFVGLAIGIFGTVIYLIFIAINRASIVSIFLTPKTTNDFAVFQLACIFLIVVALLQIVNELDTISTAALLGIKDTKIPMLIGLFSHWGIGLGSVYLLTFYWHFQGVGLMLSEYLAMLLPAIAFPLRFYLKTRKLTF